MTSNQNQTMTLHSREFKISLRYAFLCNHMFTVSEQNPKISNPIFSREHPGALRTFRVHKCRPYEVAKVTGPEAFQLQHSLNYMLLLLPHFLWIHLETKTILKHQLNFRKDKTPTFCLCLSLFLTFSVLSDGMWGIIKIQELTEYFVD